MVLKWLVPEVEPVGPDVGAAWAADLVSFYVSSELWSLARVFGVQSVVKPLCEFGVAVLGHSRMS